MASELLLELACSFLLGQRRNLHRGGSEIMRKHLCKTCNSESSEKTWMSHDICVNPGGGEDVVEVF